MSLLFQPITFKSVTLKNRIAVSPMCQYSSVDGFANDWHLVHLGSRAIGGAGLIICEATAISAEGRITPHDLGIYKEEHITYLKRITTFLEANGSVPGIQLAHAGRKASTHTPWETNSKLGEEEGAWQTVAPSAIAFKENYPLPTALDEAGIEQVINDFRTAAERAQKAGFKVIELHAAHGYLIHQFLSPISNKRTDKWGGSFENRTRLLSSVIDAVKEVWPADYPLFVRISATDWVEEGWTDDDSVALAKILLSKGIDLIDCSTGGNVAKASIPVGPLYQVPFAARIKKETGMNTGAVGMITTAQEAQQILADGYADLIFMAREMLRDPYFPLHAAKVLDENIEWPIQYERAKN